MTRRTLVCLVLLTGFQLAAVSQTLAQSLEIRFWPTDKIYTYTVAGPWLHDLVLQNVVVINRSDKPVTLEQMQISVLGNGLSTQDRLVLFNNLGQNLKSFYDKYKKGEFDVWENEYHLKEFFQDAKLAETYRLGPNEGVSIRDLYFAFNDVVDTVQVTVSGKTLDGAPIQASAKLPLDSYQSKTILKLPLVGTWQVANGPFPSVSHRWAIHQEFGYDFWKVDANGVDHKGDGTRYEDYYCYGQEVVAPADGTIYEMRNDAENAPLLDDRVLGFPEFIKKIQAYRDMLFAKGGYRELGGNYIILDHGNGEYSHFAHILKGSVRAKKGDKVKQGDLLGLVGNSGLSNVPHLHYELLISPDLPHRRGVPLRFTSINDETGARTLSFGEFVRNGSGKIGAGP